jgi:hypothetical protein
MRIMRPRKQLLLPPLLSRLQRASAARLHQLPNSRRADASSLRCLQQPLVAVTSHRLLRLGLMLQARSNCQPVLVLVLAAAGMHWKHHHRQQQQQQQQRMSWTLRCQQQQRRLV